MKNILVIGAAGQIGSELVPELRRRGYMTVAAGSGRTPLTAALSEGVRRPSSTFSTRTACAGPSNTTPSTRSSIWRPFSRPWASRSP